MAVPDSTCDVRNTGVSLALRPYSKGVRRRWEHRTERASAMAANDAALDEILGALPISTYRTGEAVLTAGSKTGQLLILKSGAVAIIKGSVEIARVKEPGA